MGELDAETGKEYKAGWYTLPGHYRYILGSPFSTAEEARKELAKWMLVVADFVADWNPGLERDLYHLAVEMEEQTGKIVTVDIQNTVWFVI